MKAINRALIEAGVLTMKDSPNGKRYGVRDRIGRITEAYGFDLAPIAARHAEFVRLAEEARVERAEMGRLRRRATVARKGIVQILETAAEYGVQGEDWADLARETRILAKALRRVERPAEMAAGRREPGAAAACGARAPGNPAGRDPGWPSEAVDSDPLGPENRPPPIYLQTKPESSSGYRNCQREV